jgi:hypothetical protein
VSKKVRRPKRKPKAKPKLPRGRTPRPGHAHRDEKKESDRTACRRFRRRKTEQRGERQ